RGVSRARGSLAACRQALALVHVDRGDPTRARALLRESLATRRELGDREGIAGCLEGLAAVAAGERPEHALRLAGAAAALRAAIGQPQAPGEQATSRPRLEPARPAAARPAPAPWAAGPAMPPRGGNAP